MPEVLAGYQSALEATSSATYKLVTGIHLQPNDRLELTLSGSEGHEAFTARVYSDSGNGQQWSPSYAARSFFERLPERRTGVDGNWLLKPTDFTALLIASIWPASQIVFANDEARLTYTSLLLQFVSQAIHARQKAAYHLSKEIPLPPADFFDHPEFPLAPYQKIGLFTSIDAPGTLLSMEQGTGKTPIAIARICYEARRFYALQKRAYKAIVVCPRNARFNWASEIHKFAVTPGRVTIIRGGQFQRLQGLVEAFAVNPDERCEYVIVIMSYETMCLMLDMINALVPEWDLGVLDESHYIKNPYTKRGAAAIKLRDRCHARMALTGTPYANTINDAFNQLEWLGRGFSGFSSFKNFRGYYNKIEKRNGKDVSVRFDNLPLLQERFARLSFRVTKKEALPELPDKLYDVHEISMTSAQIKMYIQLQSQLRVEIDAVIASNRRAGVSEVITANNVLVRLLRLAQVTSGFYKTDNEYDLDTGDVSQPGTVQFFKRNPKLEALIEILKDTPLDEKTIVWATFVPDIEAISGALVLENINHVSYYGATKENARENAIHRFNNDPNCRVFVGNPATCRESLNLLGYDLTHPAESNTDVTHVIYYSQNWSLIHRAQSEDRAHRRGTRRPVRYTDLVVPMTIDQEIRARVLNKILVAEALQDVSAIMEKVLEHVPVEEENG